MSELLTIVVPCYNEEIMVSKFLEKSENVKLNIDREYLFINDGSTDNTLGELKLLNERFPDRVSFLSFSRNFGKEAAIYAGLKNATGEYICVMDADLQDPPDLLPEMLTEIKNNHFDCIGARRITRNGEPKIRSFFSTLFYKIVNKISDTEILEGVRDYRMMTRQMVNSILEITEYNRFSKGIFSWVGYDTKYLEYENVKREDGQTTWSFWELLKYSIDGIVNYSDAPLAIATIIGLFGFFLSTILAGFFAIRTLIFNNPTPGWTSLIVVILGLGSIQLLSIGILGKYISKIYLETKRRPHYFVKEQKSMNRRD